MATGFRKEKRGMNQSQFESRYSSQWDQFRLQLTTLESPASKSLEKEVGLNHVAFSRHYRQLCNHYGLARARHYSPALVDELHNLVQRGHRQLYRKDGGSMLWAALRFIAHDFPALVRLHRLTFWLAFSLFFLPALSMGLFVYAEPALIYSVMDEDQVRAMESMYEGVHSQPGRSVERKAETQFSMFGYYILNNISIGFRTFAGGILFGVGSVFFLIFNGTLIGGVAGYLSHPPYYEVFWNFVSGHSAFELTAIVISGSAGLILGKSLLSPGQYHRSTALRRAAPAALKLVMGASLMLVSAAFVEAFWSPAVLPGTTKLAVALFNWLLVISYLLFAGRKHS